METCPKKIPSGSWLTCHWQILPKIAPACKVLSTNKLVSFCNHLLILDDKNTFKHLFNTMHLNMHYWEKNYFQSNLDTKLHQKLTAGNRAKGPPIFVVFGEMNRLKTTQGSTGRRYIYMNGWFLWDHQSNKMSNFMSSTLDLRSSSFKVFNLELQAWKK